jgi:hypothetical protein
MAVTRKVYTAEEKALYALKMKKARDGKKAVYKPKPKPRVQRAKTQYVSRGSSLEMFDAIKHRKFVLPLPNSLGDSICQDYVVRTTRVPGSSIPVVHIYTFTDSDVCGVSYNVSSTAVSALSIISFSQMSNDLPTLIRNSRMTISLLNTASGTNVAGTITAAVVKNALAWDFSTSLTAVEVSLAFQNSVTGVLEQSENSTVFTGKSCQDAGHVFSLVPTSIVNLSRWNTPIIASGGPDVVANLKATLLASGDLCSHSTLIIRFDAVANNSYNIAVNGQYAVRYPANTVLGNLGAKQPIIPADRLQRLVDDAYSKSPLGRMERNSMGGTY